MSGRIGAAVVLLAFAGICGLFGEYFLIGALRLAAGILAGLGLGVLVLAARGSWRLLAAGVALTAALALTVPAVLTARLAPLAAHAQLTIAALGDGDQVFSVPVPASPVLVRRADGSNQLLSGGEAHPVDAAPEDLLALTADGSRVLHVHGESTLVLDATGAQLKQLDGIPLAVTGDIAMMRACTGGACRISGVDLAGNTDPLWTITETADGDTAPRGPEPTGILLPARTDSPPGLLAAARATGVVPSVPLRFDPAQGWLLMDPATGFPRGEILARPQDDCRVAGAPTAETAQTPQTPLVLTLCSAEDGAMTATAFADGHPLWQSQPSPAGEWAVQMEAGRVLAAGVEEGTGVEGEIVASQHQAAWAPPGGSGLAEATPLTARMGIDGARMVVTNEAGQLLAYDTADGTNLWTLPITATTPDGVRGTLAASTVVVLDPLERERALEARGAQRLRIIDAATGNATLHLEIAEGVDEIYALGADRALVTTAEQTLLLGP